MGTPALVTRPALPLVVTEKVMLLAQAERLALLVIGGDFLKGERRFGTRRRRLALFASPVEA